MSEQTVPLVIYDEDGKREVVGEATVHEDGTITGVITDPRYGDDSPVSFGKYTNFRIDHR